MFGVGVHVRCRIRHSRNLPLHTRLLRYFTVPNSSSDFPVTVLCCCWGPWQGVLGPVAGGAQRASRVSQRAQLWNIELRESKRSVLRSLGSSPCMTSCTVDPAVSGFQPHTGQYVVSVSRHVQRYSRQHRPSPSLQQSGTQLPCEQLQLPRASSSELQLCRIFRIGDCTYQQQPYLPGTVA